MNRSTRHFVFLLALVALAVFAAVPATRALELSPEDRTALAAKESRYKVAPEMTEALQALFLPYKLDDELPGGYLFEGLNIQKHTIEVVIQKGEKSFSLHLVPPVVELGGLIETPSFKIIPEGDVHEGAAAALTAALVKNDNGTFWPAAPVESGSEGGRRVAPSVRKVHFTQVMGDLFLVLLIVAFILGFPVILQALGKQPLSWWWGLLGVVVVAFVVRLVLVLDAEEALGQGVWSASEELPYVSVAWVLNTLSRFTAVTLGSIAALNALLGALTVAGFYLLVTLLVPGIWPALVAALFVATSPMHAAFSASITVMIPLLAFLTWQCVALFAYLRTKELKAHLLAVALGLFALFARPEALAFVIPLGLAPLLFLPRQRWRRLHCWLPLVLNLVVWGARIATLGSGPEYRDPFLSLSLSAGAFHANVGTWLFHTSRVPFAAHLLWAMGVAARPWRKEGRATLFFGLWLVLAIVVYFHVDMTETFQGGRVALMALPPLVWLAAQGTRFLVSLPHKPRWWVLAVLVLWLLLAPVIHKTALRQDYRAVYHTNFLMEA